MRVCWCIPHDTRCCHRFRGIRCRPFSSPSVTLCTSFVIKLQELGRRDRYKKISQLFVQVCAGTEGLLLLQAGGVVLGSNAHSYLFKGDHFCCFEGVVRLSDCRLLRDKHFHLPFPEDLHKPALQYAFQVDEAGVLSDVHFLALPHRGGFLVSYAVAQSLALLRE